MPTFVYSWQPKLKVVGFNIDKSRLAELQPLARRNPMLAKKIIKNEALGLKQDKPEHT